MGGYLMIRTGYPVIMVVVPVVVVKKTAAFIPSRGSEENEKKRCAANAMTWKSTGQFYSEKTD